MPNHTLEQSQEKELCGEVVPWVGDQVCEQQDLLWPGEFCPWLETLDSCQTKEVRSLENLSLECNQNPSPEFGEVGGLMWSPGRRPGRKTRNGSDLQKQPAGAPNTHLNMRSPTMTSKQTDDSTTATTARMVVWS